MYEMSVVLANFEFSTKYSVSLITVYNQRIPSILLLTSLESYSFDVIFKRVLYLSLENRGEMECLSVAPVSYTHLDVYKRQVRCHVGTSHC